MLHGGALTAERKMGGRRLQRRPRKPGEMHPAHVMHALGLHPGAVRGDDPQQRRYRHVRAVLGYQAAGAQPAATVAAVAGYLQHGEAAGDLAEGDDAQRLASTQTHHYRRCRGQPARGEVVRNRRLAAGCKP
jgi:hypothetical protein